MNEQMPLSTVHCPLSTCTGSCCTFKEDEQSLSIPPGYVRDVDSVRLGALRMQGGLPGNVQATALPGKEQRATSM